MRLGVQLVRFDHAGGAAGTGPALTAAGEAAEVAGVDRLALMDHLFQIPMLGDAEAPMLEGYTTLGFLAAATSSVRLQLLVTGVTYRHPGVLAKTVATLDVLSGGRAALGLGAAWYEREHRALGVPFPPVAERLERLEETLQIVDQMWSDHDGPFHGRHYHLEETICSPRPMSTPRPQVMVGGQGERKTLRLVARYADACNLFANPDTGPEVVAAKLDVLRRHCDREGTDYDRIHRTILWSAPLDPASGAAADDFVARMADYAAVGVQEVVVMDYGRRPDAFVEALGRTVVPRLDGV